MKKLFIYIIISTFISLSSFAGSDGTNDLSKKNNGEVKDCFETFNRGVFAINQALDALVIEPIAKGYRYLPSPIRTGTSNALNNISLVVTVPNNLLQGDIGLAGKNSARFVVNSTIGILGIFDVAEGRILLFKFYGKGFGYRPHGRPARSDLESLFYQSPYGLRIPRLEDELVDFPFVDCGHDRIHIGVGRQHHSIQIWMLACQGRKKFNAGHFRHSLIGNDQINGEI